jgi:gamma-glutamyltranspeptidase/glutathione hydrolase
MKTRREFLTQTAALSAIAISRRSLYAENAARSASPSLTATGQNVAATVHPIASKAAASMMTNGGNAIDAAIAAALCLSVVDGHNSGIGGGCLMLIHTSDGSSHAIDGREKAPMAASKDMFLKQGTADVSLSQDGPLACGTPGMVAALKSAHSRFGKLPWATLFQHAIRAAFDGFPVSRSVYNTLKEEQKTIAKFPASAKILLKPDGGLYEVGERLVQRDLANTLEQIATQGADWFYQGQFASLCTAHIQQQGGVLSASDFEQYRAIDREPLRTSYRGYQVIGFPTPSSGGIHIRQMLQILARFPLKELYGHGNAVNFYHVLAESMKLAFADRAYYLGDSDFVEVPSFLTSQEYTDELAKRIDIEKSSVVPGHNDSKGKVFDDNKKHTTHMTTADRDGNWVALTATVNTSWGNKMIVPGTGVVLNNQMDDFSISPGVPNAFGLVGSKANAIEPGKRPLSSMSPTMVLDLQDQPVMTCGAAGGPRIINATLQTLLRCLDLGVPIGEAIAASRLHHQWQPDILSCEGSLGGPFDRAKQQPNQLIDQLKAKGHQIKLAGTLAIAQGIQRVPGKPNQKNQWTAACDPRADGVPASG